MALFNAARLLRRLSSRGDTTSTNTNTTTAVSPPSTPASSDLPSPSSAEKNPLPAGVSSPPRKVVGKSRSTPKLRKQLFAGAGADIPEEAKERRGSFSTSNAETPEEEGGEKEEGEEEGRRSGEVLVVRSERKTPEVKTTELEVEEESESESAQEQPPAVVVEGPTPDVAGEVREALLASAIASQEFSRNETGEQTSPHNPPDAAIFSPETLRKVRQHTAGPIRRPSLVDSANANVVKTLLDSPFQRDDPPPTSDTAAFVAIPSHQPFTPEVPDIRAMVQRKIWVKRPGASATLVQIREDDLVDDVREMILRKYANSLGKTFDAPDMTLSIATRAEHGSYRNERLLGPEEEMCRTIDSYYPGGQTVDEALIINVPQRRTPRPSPKVFSHPSYHTFEDYRPLENGTDYFPPMPPVMPTAIPQTTSSSHESRTSGHHHPSIAAAPAEHPRSISILNTGHLPPLPSPGGSTSRRHHGTRPKFNRQPTSSPTIMSHPTAGAVPGTQPIANQPPGHMTHRASTRPRMDSSAAAASDAHAVNGIAPAQPALPTPPAQEGPSASKTSSNPPTPSGTSTNPHVMTSHRPSTRPRKSRKPTPEDRATSNSRNNKTGPSAPSVNPALDNAAVPPINVLIVEDNIINLRILEGLMKRLKVRWQTAMNGQIAVDKWKAGGFHLVLMDIQMPVMSGLQAAREIRRLERVNGIGVFGELESPLSPHNQNGSTTGTPGTTTTTTTTTNGEETTKPKPNNPTEDKLLISEGLFKSPVIIVALTASSLQSDRHEALAAGCNDFLNKPVNLVWLERKVKEWGCMQALIDYDGWRAWKDYAAEQEKGKSAEEKRVEREKEEKARVKAEKLAKLQEKQAGRKKEEEAAAAKKKRESLNSVASAGAADGGTVEGAGEGGVNEATVVALKSGREFLKDANLGLE